MKHPLMLAAVLVALTGTAHAQPIPAQFLGRWCDQSNDGLTYRRAAHDERCGTRVSWMIVTAHGYRLVDGICAALKVTKLRLGYHIKFRCVGQGMDELLITEFTWKIQDDTLLIGLPK